MAGPRPLSRGAKDGVRRVVRHPFYERSVWQLCTLRGHGHTEGVCSVAFSADGKRIVSGSHDHLVKIWDAATGGKVSRLGGALCEVRIGLGHSCEVTVCRASDGGMLLTAGCPQIWSSMCHNGEGRCCCTRQDAPPFRVIVNASCPLKGHSASVSRVAFSDDGAQVFSSSRDGTVRFWDIEWDTLMGHTGTEVRQLKGDDFAFVESPSDGHKRGRYVLTSYGNTLLIYEGGAKDEQHAEDGAAEIPVACFMAPQRINSFHCHGATICVGCSGGEVCVLRAPFLGV